MWKPGNLVTIKGVVYRVKREYKPWHACRQCAFGSWLYTVSGEPCCQLPVRNYGKYPLPEDCYLERVSPIKRKPLIMKVNYYE